MKRLGKPAFSRLGMQGLPYGFGSQISLNYVRKVLRPNPIIPYDPTSLIGFWLQDEQAGGVSYDRSGLGHHGAYTGVTLGQPGVPGMGMTSAYYDGITDFDNIHSADLANDNALLNPGFETPGAMPPTWANWVDSLGDGAIANEVVIVHEGTDAAKITSGVTSNTNTNGNIAVTPGQRRRFRFWSRGDGTNAGRYLIFDVTNGANISPGIVSTGITAAAWGMVVFEYTVPAGCFSVRDFLLCPPVNGGIAYFDACEDRRTNGFLGDQGTAITWVSKQVGNTGYEVYIAVDNNNRVRMRSQDGAAIDMRYYAGGVNQVIAIAEEPENVFRCMAMSWDIAAGATGEVRGYLGGVAGGGVQVGLGTWLGDLSNTETVLGAQSTVPANPANIWMGPSLLYSEAKTPAEIAYLSVV